MKCRTCGTQNERGARICTACGGILDGNADDDRTMALPPVETDDEPAQFEAVAELEPALVVTKGPFAGQRFVLTQTEITIGRDPGSDIFLDDITVSRRHARILVSDEGFYIEDFGSLNGTYVNGDRVDKRMLCAGDELQIGKYKLVFTPAKK